MNRTKKQWEDWEKRVQQYEREGCTRSDAQGVADADDFKEDGEDIDMAEYRISDR